MLRWIALFVVLAAVAAIAVFITQGGPPPALGGDPPLPPLKPVPTDEHPAIARDPEAPNAAHSIGRIPLVVVFGGRLESRYTIQVPALHDGQLMFTGMEIPQGEAIPKNAIKQSFTYLVTEAQPGEDGVKIKVEVTNKKGITENIEKSVRLLRRGETVPSTSRLALCG